MTSELKDIIRKVLHAGVSGRHFQFRDIREALGIDSQDHKLSRTAWNRFITLHRDELIEEVGHRGRHKYYRVKDEAKLRERLPTCASPASPPFKLYGRLSTALQPPARLEQELHELRGEQQRFREEINAKIDELVRLWS